MSKNPFVVWFDQVGKEDIALVGGKGANLGEMTQAKIPVPPGFIVTASAYFYFIQENKLERDIRHILKTLHVDEPDSLNRVSIRVKRLIMDALLPKDLATEILKSYHALTSYRVAKSSSLLKKIVRIVEEPLVAVRSSATAEDLPTASFAGQQATFLNVEGDADLLKKVKACYASLFEARAIFYRHENQFDHFKVGIAVPVQLMVQSDVSGVMFTIDPVTNDKGRITIEAVFGLGELIVQGAITPDHYEVDKNTLHIERKQIEHQSIMLTRIGKRTKEVKVAKSTGRKQKLSDGLVLEVAKLGKKIENHYFFPQDIEWAIEDDTVYIVQTRPITTINNQQSTINKEKQNALEVESLKLKVLLRGDPASPGIVSGPVKVIQSAKEINRIKPGDVLVAPKTNPDYVPAMRKAAAIVTDFGGRTSHAAIVSRELGIPCVVGTENATKKLKTGLVITVNGSTGEVFRGGIKKGGAAAIGVNTGFAHTFPHGGGELNTIHTATKVYVNLAEESRVADIAKMHVDGVGLLRAEFMISDIGLHPRKIIKDRRQKMFIEKLASHLKTFCEHFNPRPVVYRLSDFKTNEYRNLGGGAKFEPEEENPMMGFRGAHRFIAHPETLKLEVDAIMKVRNAFSFRNLWVMIPYVRTVSELTEMKKLLSGFGLARSSSFKLWMMVEIPSNIILIDDFISVGIDGVSIGSNDLTMLTLGTDRDNSELASLFSERDPAVIASLEKVIKACHKYGITSSICGQAPSTYPDLVETLVRMGITSISVNPDAVDDVRKTVHEAEKKILRRQH